MALFFNAIWLTWLELAPWMLLGACVAGLLHVWLPDGWLQQKLSGGGGVWKAVVLGIPLPLCSCGVIPVGLGLRKSGVSDGAAVGFLISTPQTGVDSILVAAAFLGWPFALLKVGVALVTGLVGGFVTNALSSSAASNVQETTVRASQRTGMLIRFANHATEMLRSIWGWLLVGVIVSSAITTMLPEGRLHEVIPLAGVSALLLTLLIALPLYVCATASVPIAAALVASGFPPGAALVFLMAGPATNLATLGAVYRTLGGRALTVYLLSIGAGSLLAGLLFNEFLPAGVGAVHVHDHGPNILSVVCGLALIGLIGWFAVEEIRQRLRRNVVTADSSQSVTVTGMTCAGCVGRLQRTLEAHPQIDRADVSLDEGVATISGSASRDQIDELVSQAGFAAVTDSRS